MNFGHHGPGSSIQDFPGGPGVRTQGIHCQVFESIPGLGTKMPQAARDGQKEKREVAGGCSWHVWSGRKDQFRRLHYNEAECYTNIQVLVCVFTRGPFSLLCLVSYNRHFLLVSGDSLVTRW